MTHDYPKTHWQVLRELAETTDPELEADRYGNGDLIAGFESVATLLGKVTTGRTLFELAVVDATLDLSGQEIVYVFRMVLARVSG